MNNLKTLTEPSTLNNNAFEFDKIDEQNFIAALDQSIELAQKRISKIKTNPENATFDNTIVALECCSPEMSKVLSAYYHLFSACTTDHLQSISQEVSKKSVDFHNSISLDADLFLKVKTVYENKDQITDKEDLKLLEDTHKSFIRNGANLDETDKKAFSEISSELAALSPQFSQNLLNSTNAYELHLTNKSDVDGLPESALKLAQSTAKEKDLDGWLFTLQYPSFLPFMKYCKNRELRQKMYMAFSSRAYQGEFSNQDIVKKTVNLRLKRAQLLGFKTHADYVLQERMAQTPDQVFNLFDQLYSHSLKHSNKDVEKVKALALEKDQIEDFKPWDFTFYSELLKKESLNFDEEKLRPYFEVNSSVEGAFAIASKLYQVEFKKADYPTWHEDVSVYEVYDLKTNEFVGLFYCDLFPRKSKRSGAWANSFKKQGLTNGSIERPHTVIVCNFSPSTEDTPSLLTLREVQTLFHEFGHALHMLLTQCKYKSLSGASVYWDFVELPSQIMENWVSEKECLDLFAKHYETGESIPQDYIDAILKSQQFLAGYMSLRQLRFGALDMAWHTLESEFTGDVSEFENKVTEKYNSQPPVDGTCSSTAFGHLFAGGYSAGYYSYKWAEILDADAFEYFKEEGIFNQDVANKFKTHILERGGTDHPMTLYKNFRGREPKTDALLKREGFI